MSFLAFSAFVAVTGGLGSHRKWRGCVLLLANLFFLSTLSPQATGLVPLAVFLAVGFGAVRASGRWRSGRLLVALVTGLTLGFCWLKKYWFLGGIGFLEQAYVTVGLSYMYFRVIHLVVDANDAEELAGLDPLSYANYVLNFTTLVAGPIQRYEDFSSAAAPLDLPIAGRALERIVIGLFKVLVLSALLSGVHDDAVAGLFSHGDDPRRIGFGLIAIVGYPLYLYFNFSGYMDIVIGVGRFVGQELPENFNRPFSALNTMDFWARYHMTLSGWLRSYVYTPLLTRLMERFAEPRFDLALGILAAFVTFLLMGLWHGPTLAFAAYGLCLATGVGVNQLYQAVLIRKWGRSGYRSLTAIPAYRACCRGLTFTWYAASMVCFWASGKDALRLLDVLGSGGVAACIGALFLTATLFLAVVEAVRAKAIGFRWNGSPLLLSRHVRTVWATVLAFLCVCMAVLAQSPAPDIVYKSF